MFEALQSFPAEFTCLYSCTLDAFSRSDQIILGVIGIRMQGTLMLLTIIQQG